jgi:hypothetical protein
MVPAKTRRGRPTFLRISAATYDAGTHAVTLLLAGKPKLNRMVQLTVSGSAQGGLRDLAGNLLAGLGTAGTNATVNFKLPQK